MSRVRSIRRMPVVWVVVVLIVVAISWAVSSRPSGQSTSVPTTVEPFDTSAAVALLDTLTSSPGTDTAGYSRAQFGDGWKDPDANGCDTRNDILARDLQALTFRVGTHDCIVLTGELSDVYTGKTIEFVRGNATSDAVQIDHMVPLSWAWTHGASDWTANQRLLFANDPNNLTAVDGPTNGSKSDSGPAKWMPPAASYACTYVQRFLSVLVTYKLAIDAPDRLAMRAVLARC